MLSYGLDLSIAGRALLVLTTTGESGPAELLEAERFNMVGAEPILATMGKWESWYAENCPGLAPPRSIAGCAQDGWSGELVRRVEGAGYRFRWVAGPRPDQLGAHLDPQFMRARLLAHWPAPAMLSFSRRAMLQAQHAVLWHEVLNLEAELYAEGHSLCPGHVSASCPDCEHALPARPLRRLQSAGRRP